MSGCRTPPPSSNKHTSVSHLLAEADTNPNNTFLHTWAPFTPESHHRSILLSLSCSLSAAALFIQSCPGPPFLEQSYINSHSRLRRISVPSQPRRRLQCSLVAAVLIRGCSVISVTSFCVLVQGSSDRCSTHVSSSCSPRVAAVPKGFNGVLTPNLVWLRNR